MCTRFGRSVRSVRQFTPALPGSKPVESVCVRRSAWWPASHEPVRRRKRRPDAPIAAKSSPRRRTALSGGDTSTRYTSPMARTPATPCTSRRRPPRPRLVQVADLLIADDEHAPRVNRHARSAVGVLLLRGRDDEAFDAIVAAARGSSAPSGQAPAGSYAEVGRRLGVSRVAVWRWRARLPGLAAALEAVVGCGSVRSGTHNTARNTSSRPLGAENADG